MNFLQISRVSFDRVAENIITCLSCGVPRKISWTSRRISEKMSDLTITVVQFWKTPVRESFRIVPRCDGTYQGHRAFCHIHREQSVWYFSSSMIGRGSKPWGDLELRRQYEVGSPSMFSCPCRLAYHRKIQQPKRETVSSGWSPCGPSGAWIPDMNPDIPLDFPCILKIFDILLRFERRVHECGTWPTLEGHLSCLLFLCPIVAMLLKQKRLFYPYRIWPDRQHPFR